MIPGGHSHGFANRVQQFRVGKQTTRAARGCDVGMSQHSAAANAKPSTQPLQQAFRRSELTGRRRRSLEVSHETDADAVQIVRPAPGVGPVQLLLPTKGRLDASIGHAQAIAQHKMISNAGPLGTELIAPLTVRLVDRRDIAFDRSRMVQDDILPRAGFHGWFPQRRIRDHDETSVLR